VTGRTPEGTGRNVTAATKKVVIVGVGALGSHVVMFLRNAGATLKCVDFDRVDQKNVASQFHTKMGVGKSKVEALKQTMLGLFSIKIEGVPHKLTEDNAKELLGGADLVVDCLDNAPSREVVQEFVRAAGIPCLHGALDAEGSFGRAAWDEVFRIDSGSLPGTATCEDGGFLPFIAVVASYIAFAANVFLTTGDKIGFEITPGGSIRT
jgi:predicted ThiF/HesA family dinucleotide-utilizing enzyme